MEKSYEHVVRADEDIGSIAARLGFFWETLWEHPGNERLRRERADPMVLEPGDRVVIPERRGKEVDAADSQRHRFRRRGVPAELTLRFLDGGEPRADTTCRIEIDGVTTWSSTDENGVLVVLIPPDASAGKVIVGEGAESVAYALNLGHLGPPETVKGVQARLRNLGFYTGPIDGARSDWLAEALWCFQQRAGVEETGEPCAATCQRLQEMNGS